METLGSFLRYAREQRGIQAQVVAKAIGVSKAYVGDIEKDRRMPAEETLRALVEYLDVSYDEALAYAGKLDRKTRQYLLAHPTAMKLLRRIAEIDLDEERIVRLMAEIDFEETRLAGMVELVSKIAQRSA